MPNSVIMVGKATAKAHSVHTVSPSMLTTLELTALKTVLGTD